VHHIFALGLDIIMQFVKGIFFVRFLAQAYNVKLYVGMYRVEENVLRGHVNNVVA
jgi:hypothetical protein